LFSDSLAVGPSAAARERGPGDSIITVKRSAAVAP
jgi:hypothetical protein